ncbi:MAG: hypothetical protein AABY00_00675 [Nanoarchaeota archaeon]
MEKRENQEEKKEKIIIKEIPSKVKIIRQISEEERTPSARPSGLERREEEVEREFSSSATSNTNNNFLIRSNAPPTSIQQVRTTGNTAVQQNPQEESEAVRRWYAQSTKTAEQERKYQLSTQGSAVIPQDNSFGRRMIGENQELQNIQNRSIDNEDKYNLNKPEKKETRRRYPWEV